MRARLRAWWQQVKQHRVTILVVAIILVVVIALIIVGYRFDWTGFNGKNKSGKTLWDWMQLLFIPVVLAVAGFWFNHRERKAAELRAEAEREIEQKRALAEREISEDNQREAALQEYLDRMSELLLHENLRRSKPDEEVQKIARARTLTVLRRLDGERKGSVLRFLHEANLIDDFPPIIDLHEADLRGAHLAFADLRGADLSGADLSGANLDFANLSGADLDNTNLRDASLLLTDLKGIYRSPDDM